MSIDLQYLIHISAITFGNDGAKIQIIIELTKKIKFTHSSLAHRARQQITNCYGHQLYGGN